mgnify:CR=1 FL=1
MILQCSHIDKAFSTDVILSDISFHINEHEKAAIVGANGSGKSTLLKIITGHLSADNGEVILSGSTTVGYLAQNQEYASEHSIYDEMRDAKPEIIQLEQQMEKLSARMDIETGETLEQVIKQYDNARQRYERLDGYAYQSELVGVLKGLGFTEEDFEKPVVSLSGGEKTRVALAKMLLQAPDLIILDEPTNHLDINAIAWLESYLTNYRGAVLIVAHDRYFLDKIVTKVIELRQTHARMYMGNYSEYAAKRQQIMDSLMKQYLNQQAEIKHQEEVITKLKSFNREKSIKRAESREKLLDKIERIEKPTEDNTDIRIVLEPNVVSGNDVLKVEGLAKAFPPLQLFSGINFEVKRGERVALIGNNGTGKTTILKIINELISPDAGTVTLGSNVHIGYYDQEHQQLHMEKTIFDEIADDYPNLNNTKVRNVLAAFLFTDDDVYKRIEDLSGGERGRVALAKLMLSDANFLILDEPTNHLDITSKEILEEALKSYTGTVFFVSHDRYFINQTATRILELTGETVVNYIGNYDYYLEKHDQMVALYVKKPEDEAQTEASVKETAQKVDWQTQKAEQARIRKIENALKKAEEKIAELEEKIASIDAECAKPEVAVNSAKLGELTKQQSEYQEELEKQYEVWEELSMELDA